MPEMHAMLIGEQVQLIICTRGVGLMLSLLKLDFKNCINSFKFKICFLSVWIISIISYLGVCTEYFNSNSLKLQSTNNLGLIMNPNIRQMYFLLFFALPLISTFIYSDSFIYERENNICPYYFVRQSKTLYFISKIIVNFIVVFFTIFIGLSINEILTQIAIPNIGVLSGSATPAYQLVINDPKTSGMFRNDLYVNHPYLYNYFIIFITAIFCALISVIAFNISLLFRMKKVTLLIVTFLCVNISLFLLPEKYQFQMYIQAGPDELYDFHSTILGWIIVLIITGIVGIWRKSKEYE